MNTIKQTLPALSIERLDNGLIRLDQPDGFGEYQCVYLAPVHVQVLTQMIDRPLPDRTRATLAKLHKRMTSLHTQADGLRRLLVAALNEGEGVGVELNTAETLAERMADLAEDIAELATPADETPPSHATSHRLTPESSVTHAGPGDINHGQLTLENL